VKRCRACGIRVRGINRDGNLGNLDMKSAYELAMERLGGSKTYTDEQKRDLAGIDRVYEARKAEVRLQSEDRLKKVGDDPDGAKSEEIRQAMARDLARLDQRREAEKDKVRNR
jgi:hypothetical protein